MLVFEGIGSPLNYSAAQVLNINSTGSEFGNSTLQGYNANFAGAITVTLPSPDTATFTSTISGQSFALSGSLTSNSAAGPYYVTITFAGPGDFTISGTVSGANTSFTDNGTGTLTLSGNAIAQGGQLTVNSGAVVLTGNSANGTGPVVVNGGTLTVGIGAVMGPGNVTVNSGGTFVLNGTASAAILDVAGGTMSMGLAGVAQYTGATVGTGGLLYTVTNNYATSPGQGGATFQLTNSANTLLVQGQAFFAPGTTVLSQQINVASGANMTLYGLADVGSTASASNTYVYGTLNIDGAQLAVNDPITGYAYYIQGDLNSGQTVVETGGHLNVNGIIDNGTVAPVRSCKAAARYRSSPAEW